MWPERRGDAESEWLLLLLWLLLRLVYLQPLALLVLLLLHRPWSLGFQLSGKHGVE